ncbi:MAG TPA: DUF4358 domain-containing protein [Clostridiales bacterium]|jgi:hypothetical protein|nr:DUF4358 domain-containing protein [Clostridiales bacterium]
MNKKAVKTILTLILAVILFASCGKKVSYRDDLTAKEVIDKIEATVPLDDGYYSVDSDYLDFYFEGADALIDSYEIRIANTSTNINQFGVFKVKDGQAEAMQALCRGYLSLKMERWVLQADYIAAEHPKMEDAEVRIFGNYVVYTILTKQDKTAVFKAVEELLKQ